MTVNRLNFVMIHTPNVHKSVRYHFLIDERDYHYRLSHRIPWWLGVPILGALSTIYYLMDDVSSSIGLWILGLMMVLWLIYSYFPAEEVKEIDICRWGILTAREQEKMGSSLFQRIKIFNRLNIKEIMA